MISLTFSGFHSSLEGMTEDRVIEPVVEEESVSPAMRLPATVEGFQEDNMHEEYSSIDAIKRESSDKGTFS